MLSAFRLLAAAFAVVAHSGAAKPEPAFKALAQLSGADSTIESPRVVAITSEADWVTLWREHRSSFQVGVPTAQQNQDPDRPKIDFDKVAVLGLFGGQSKNVGGFRVSDSGDSGKDAYVRIEPVLLPNSGTTILQNPYIFVEVPKTKKKIIVQLDQVPLGGEGWRTLAVIQPTKD